MSSNRERQLALQRALDHLEYKANGTNVLSIIFRDVLFNMVLGLFMILIIILPYLNPPTDAADTIPPGNIYANIFWTEGDIDVDLWVDGPVELAPVGYSNKGGVMWNLVRDDLGNYPDAGTRNYENAYTRGILAGEYIINVHCYRCPVLPVKVDLEVGVSDQNKKGSRILVSTKAELVKTGQEITMIRFKLTDDGQLVKGSMHNVFKPLRSKQKTAEDFGGVTPF